MTIDIKHAEEEKRKEKGGMQAMLYASFIRQSSTLPHTVGISHTASTYHLINPLTIRVSFFKNGLGISSPRTPSSHTGTGSNSLSLSLSFTCPCTVLPPALACANSTSVRPPIAAPGAIFFE